MTRDETRELFGAALDEDLDAEQRQRFDAALGADAELAKEYREFSEFYAALRRPAPDERVPDLLPGVQHRLRARSRGRFYRDRFAERAGRKWQPTLWIGLVMLALLALAWLAMSVFEAVSLK